jgi:hypothetical protein
MYVAKEQFILERSSGRSVLHLGCVGFTDIAPSERAGRARQSLHWKLTHLCDTVGIDRSVAVIEECRRNGIFTNVVAGDVERLEEVELARTFDVIVAGDIIEHLSNPGRMLDGIRRFCTGRTQVILTTPNAFGAPNFMRHSFGKFREGDEHVICFNAQNLATLLKRHGFYVSELHTCFQPLSRKRGIAFELGRRALELFPRFGGTLLAVAKISVQ